MAPHFPVWAGILCAVTAFAGQPIPLPSGHSVTLPDTWEVLESPPAESASLPQVLLRARRRGDETTAVTVYRLGATPPPNVSRVQEESLFAAILAQGLAPTRTLLRYPELAPFSATLEVDTDAARTFTITTLTTARDSVRMVTSASGPEAIREVRAIIESFRNLSAPEKTADPSPEHARLVQEGALLRVGGKKSTGGGFLCRLEGKPYAFTATSVLAANPGFRLITLTNERIPFGDCALAQGRDLARFLLTTAPAVAFDALTGLENRIQIGDEVIVAGPFETTRRIYSGKVTGIGPDRIETNAPFPPECSGGPIIHVNTGKVIGIAIAVPAPQNGGEPRRTGFRLDQIRHWERVIWPRFYHQAAEVEALEKVTADLLQLAAANGTLRVADYQTREIRGPLEAFLASIPRAVTPASRSAATQQLVAEIRNASRNDLRAFNAPLAYDYFRRGVEEQQRQREAAMEKLVRSLETILQSPE